MAPIDLDDPLLALRRGIGLHNTIWELLKAVQQSDLVRKASKTITLGEVFTGIVDRDGIGPEPKPRAKTTTTRKPAKKSKGGKGRKKSPTGTKDKRLNAIVDVLKSAGREMTPEEIRGKLKGTPLFPSFGDGKNQVSINNFSQMLKALVDGKRVRRRGKMSGTRYRHPDVKAKDSKPKTVSAG